MNVNRIKRDKLSHIQLRRRLDDNSVLIENYEIDSGDVHQRKFSILHTHQEDETAMLVKIDYFTDKEKGEKIKLSIPKKDKKNKKKWGFFPKKRGREIMAKDRINAYKRLFRKSYYTTFRTVDEMLGMAANAFVEDVDVTSQYTKYSTINPNINEKYILTIDEE